MKRAAANEVKVCFASLGTENALLENMALSSRININLPFLVDSRMSTLYGEIILLIL